MATSRLAFRGPATPQSVGGGGGAQKDPEKGRIGYITPTVWEVPKPSRAGDKI